MDKKSKHLMGYISKAMDHPDVSGFEALELLDVRSRMASREPLLDESEKAHLEDLDRRLLQMSESWLERISEVAGLAEMRRRSHICHHIGGGIWMKLLRPNERRRQASRN